MDKSRLFWLNNHLCSLFWSFLLFSSTLSTPYRSFIPNLDFIILKYLIYLWYPHNLFMILPRWFFYLNVNLLTFIALLELSTLRHCAELLWLTSGGVGWLEIKKEFKKNQFKSKKSDLNQINLIFLIFCRGGGDFWTTLWDKIFKLVEIFVVASLEWENVISFSWFMNFNPLDMGPKFFHVVLYEYLRVFLSTPFKNSTL